MGGFLSWFYHARIFKDSLGVLYTLFKGAARLLLGFKFKGLSGFQGFRRFRVWGGTLYRIMALTSG